MATEITVKEFAPAVTSSRSSPDLSKCWVSSGTAGGWCVRPVFRIYIKPIPCLTPQRRRVQLARASHSRDCRVAGAIANWHWFVPSPDLVPPPDKFGKHPEPIAEHRTANRFVGEHGGHITCS